MAEQTETKAQNQNPWLAGLAISGVLSLFFGGILVLANQPSGFGPTSSQATALLLGSGLAQIGGGLVVAWLLASAICWQISRDVSSDGRQGNGPRT